MGDYYRIEDLIVYQRLCRLHIEICDLTKLWPAHERYSLCSQIERSSNSSPAQLAEKHSDRHVRNKIEGVNRSRGETLETVHHLFIAAMKGYIEQPLYVSFRDRYHECVRMLNGMERTLEQQLPVQDRRWPDKSHPEP